jgi:hypothetical protein
MAPRKRTRMTLMKLQHAIFASIAGMTTAMAPAFTWAQHEHAGHEQNQHDQQHATGGAVTQLKLNGAAKWATDASLREGMRNVRAAFDADHPAIHAGTQTDDAYALLASRVEQQVKSIIANCRLPADADANLHFIVADLLQSVSIMRGEDSARSRHDGASLVHGLLRAYPRYFDDPAWKPDAPMPSL